MEGSLSNLLPSLVKEGVFGDVELVDIKYTKDETMGAQFGSGLNFVTLNVKGTTEESLDIVVKSAVSFRPDSLGLFQVELLMYKEVLPALGFKTEWYPKFYYGFVDHENPENSVLIFDNLKSRNYSNSPSKIFLDYGHISVAMKKLAKFHSLSFILKHEHAQKFEELKNKIKGCSIELPESMKSEANVDAQIAVRAFQEEHGKEELLEQFLNVLGNMGQIMELFDEPKEPFAVICHGDFCNNNVIYKYDKNGSPIDCAFLDFQMSRYSTIVSDLSFFLYLNTDSELREKYWDEFLKIYWETLRENVPEHISVPSFENFLEHFSQFAIHGLNISTFFLPVMMDPFPADTIFSLTEEDHDERRRSPKGQEISRKVIDLVSHFYHKEYLHALLDYMNKS
ncbi:uncharacterized protein [Halyomorpha halys]|uniref:uncharacterized protein n=1 Tax=Halyomorpha halys TaxID=286706 RepID=UPI0006D4F3C2|nr:uncharacterized protein LOC106685898 [Halyomorpha halys]KAE8573786.1 EcKinase 35 [Halyomorpha halys]